MNHKIADVVECQLVSDRYCVECECVHKTETESIDYADLKAGELFRWADGIPAMIYRKRDERNTYNPTVWREMCLLRSWCPTKI